MESIFKEILTDHVDEHGVIHIDGYKTDDDNEEGIGIGYFINGETYWRDSEFQFDPLVKETIERLLKEEMEGKVKLTLDNVKILRQRLGFDENDESADKEIEKLSKETICRYLIVWELGYGDLMDKFVHIVSQSSGKKEEDILRLLFD